MCSFSSPLLHIVSDSVINSSSRIAIQVIRTSQSLRKIPNQNLSAPLGYLRLKTYVNLYTVLLWAVQFTGLQNITGKGHFHCSECCRSALRNTTYLPSAGISRNGKVSHYCRPCQRDIERKLQVIGLV